MNQEKKLTQSSKSAGRYLAPKIKMVELKARRVICQSGGNYDNSSGNAIDETGI